VISARAVLALFLALAAGGAVLARGSQLVRGVELETLDWRFRAMPARTGGRADPGIALLYLDQQSLDAFEKDDIYWPWPRSVYAPVLEFCKAAGAKAVVFDVLFTSPSPYGPSEDTQLARALSRSGKAVLAMEMSAGRGRPAPAALARFALKDAEGAPAAPRQSVRAPVPALLPAAAGVGDVATSPDFDGVYRRVPLLSTLDGRYYPTLAAASTLAALGGGARADGRDALLLGGRRVPLEDGKLLIRFHGPRAYPAYPLGRVIKSWDALESHGAPSLSPEALSGKIVFVGLSAPGLRDLRPSPVDPAAPGTSILAAAVETILNEDYLRRPAPAWAALLLLLALAWGAGASLWASDIRHALGAVLAGSGLLAAAAVLAFQRGLILDMALPQALLFLGFASSAAYGYAVEGRKKRQITKAFTQYLAPEIVAEIAEDPEHISLGGESRRLTCYFSDIEGFTTISEGLTPERLTYLMNRYLGEMTDTILESGGTLDKYIGDAIMAFWGAPKERPDHALAACKVALDNQSKLAALREALIKEGFPPVRARIGLNSGTAKVGNMGSARRFSYTALGDDINLASRLEGANKLYGSYILISEATRAQAGAAIEVRELDRIKVKGKDKAVTVYELLGLAGAVDARALEKARSFEAALALYRARKFKDASAAFERQQKDFGPDTACELYLERCADFSESSPAEDWDGSVALTEK
jgi:adenylate cyclase